MTFTLTNPNPTTTITGITFVDNLPAGLVGGFPIGSTCSGAAFFIAQAGSHSFTVSSITMAGGTTCTATVTVTGTTLGTKNNTTDPVTSNEAGTGGTASATIVVAVPPSIAKSFSPTTVGVGATAVLTFTIVNPNATVSLSGVAFIDALPSGLTVASGTSSVCITGTLTLTAPGTINLSGAMVAASSSCVFSVTVTGSASGDYTNTTGSVTSTNGGTGNMASANLLVASPPTIIKSFGAAAVPVGGTTSVSFSITNPNTALALTGVGFTDSLPGGLVVATPNGLSGSCDTGGITAVAGSSSISLSGATLASSAGCSFSVNVTGLTAGVKNNSTLVISNEGGLGNTSNASITVVGPPSISKAFGTASIQVNGSTTLTFTITNPNGSSGLTGVGFSDTLPAGLVVATPPGAGGTCGGASSATAGASSLSITGSSIAASGSCTFSVNVTGTTAGIKNNTSGNVTSTEGGTGGTASASVDVVAPPSIAKSFSPADVPLGATSVLTFTISNPNSAVTLIGVAFTDTLPTGLTIASGSSSVCGGSTLTTTAPTTISYLSGPTMAAASSCVFSVSVTGAASGNYTNTTGPVTSINGGTGNTASANLLVANTTTVTYTGPSHGDFNDPLTLIAQLMDTSASPSVLVSNQTLLFKLDGQSCSGVTDANGNASCTLTPNEAAGPYPLTVSFTPPPGSQYTGSGTSITFTVTLEETALSYTGPTTFSNGSPANLSAVLTEDGITGIGGRAVTLTLGLQSCTGTTLPDGSVSCAITAVSQAPGSTPITGSFAGDPFYQAAAFAITGQIVSPTTLSYTGATSGDFRDPATVSAHLADVFGNPVVGVQVQFTLNSTETCSATTDAFGNANCAITPGEPAGLYTVAAAFAGNANYSASHTSAGFTLTREETATHYTGPVIIANGSSATLSAVLKEDNSQPIAGRIITFTLGTGSSAQSCTATTDASGIAGCTIPSVNQPLGPGTVTASFSGDAFYLASSDSTLQTFIIPPSTAGCDIDGAGKIVATNGDKAKFEVDFGSESASKNDEDSGNDEANEGDHQTKNGAAEELPENVQTYSDLGPKTPFSFMSTTNLAATCTGKTSGSIYGTGLINGTTPVFFIIDVTSGNAEEDGNNDREGHTAATYRIRLTNGYDSGVQNVKSGNISVHLESDEEDSQGGGRSGE